MQVYTGKLLGQKIGQMQKIRSDARNRGRRIVLQVTAALQGHTITSKYFFTSYTLCTELLKRKLSMVGTVCKNKPGLPHVDRRHLDTTLWKNIEGRATKRRFPEEVRGHWCTDIPHKKIAHTLTPASLRLMRRAQKK